MVVSYIHAVRSRDGDNDEGSISPLIVGMCALVLLIASVTLAVTGAHVQTHRLEDLADAQAISIVRTIEHGFSNIPITLQTTLELGSLLPNIWRRVELLTNS